MPNFNAFAQLKPYTKKWTYHFMGYVIGGFDTFEQLKDDILYDQHRLYLWDDCYLQVFKDGTYQCTISVVEIDQLYKLKITETK